MARTPKVVEDRREQILDAAMRVFSQKGFSGATNKDIAREANITAGLIYHYFENKKAVLNAIIEERSPLGLLKALSPQIVELPPQTFLPFLVQRVLTIVEDERFVQLIRLILPEVIHGSDPAIAQLGTNALGRMLKFVAGYFASKMESGELRQTDAVLAGQTLIGSVIGFVLRRQILHDAAALQYSHEQIAQAVVETVLQGLLPR